MKAKNRGTSKQERELMDGKCPDHEVEPETIKESNYFFKMSSYQDWLIDHIRKNPEFIRPQRYRNGRSAFIHAPPKKAGQNSNGTAIAV